MMSRLLLRQEICFRCSQLAIRVKLLAKTLRKVRTSWSAKMKYSSKTYLLTDNPKWIRLAA